MPPNPLVSGRHPLPYATLPQHSDQFRYGHFGRWTDPTQFVGRETVGLGVARFQSVDESGQGAMDGRSDLPTSALTHLQAAGLEVRRVSSTTPIIGTPRCHSVFTLPLNNRATERRSAPTASRRIRRSFVSDNSLAADSPCNRNARAIALMARASSGPQ